MHALLANYMFTGPNDSASTAAPTLLLSLHTLLGPYFLYLFSQVVDSGPNDEVFLFFSDHGAPGEGELNPGELAAKKRPNSLKY